jgi:hypothetical protein
MWCFDMDKAPKGETVTVQRTIGKNICEVEEHRSVTIIAAGADGSTVTLSQWMPEAGRWRMFAAKHPPTAWMPYPKHPSMIIADAPAPDQDMIDALLRISALTDALTETTAILQASVVAGKVRGGDSYRIGGVYLQTVSDALDAADAALTIDKEQKT